MYEERNLVSMIQLQLRISKFFVGFFSWKLSKLLKDSLFNSGKSTRIEETRVFNFTINEYIYEFEYFYFNLFRSNVCRFVSIVS